MVEAIDAGQEIPKVTVPQTVDMIAEAWESVTPSTIRKCWALTEDKGKGKEKEKSKEQEGIALHDEELAQGLKKIAQHTNVKVSRLEDYVAVDSTLETCQEKTEQEIEKEIAVAMKGGSPEEEKEEECNTCSLFVPIKPPSIFISFISITRRRRKMRRNPP